MINMEIYLMRHALGTNTDLATDGLLDLFDNIARIRNGLGERKPVIYSSPQGRAVNTARVISREFYNVENNYVIEIDLDLRANNVLDALNRLKSPNYPVILITHEPCIKRFEEQTGIACEKSNALYTLIRGEAKWKIKEPKVPDFK